MPRPATNNHQLMPPPFSMGLARVMQMASAGWFVGALVVLSSHVEAAESNPIEPSAAKAAFMQKCAGCHGEQGEGTDNYKRTLAGDTPLTQLTKYIDETMPEGEPETCTGDEARAIAEYIHGAFYSPLAQARIRPPRRELSRLTVRQYQQTVADLLGAFRGGSEPTDQQGLAASYHHSEWADPKKQIAERIESTVDFELIGSGLIPPEILFPPDDPKLGDTQKARRHRILCFWSGGVVAPATGDYELIVKTKSAVQMDFNGEPRVIDARVRAANETDCRATVRLIEGRAYPISLSVTREVEDDVVVQLAWKSPGSVEQTIPARYLRPTWQPRVTVVTTPFPPDDRSVGYVRGSSVSAAWTESALGAALEVAKQVVDELPELLGVGERGSDLERHRPRVVRWCEAFAERACRRPLDDAESQALVGRWFEQDRDTSEAALLAVIATLKSPAFLYPEVATARSSIDYRHANRLALGLWDSLPDDQLLEAAAEGRLHTPEQITQQAERMLTDQRTRSKLNAFFRHWLHLEGESKLQRNREVFPDFSAQVAADMQASLQLFLEDVVWNGNGDFRQLFLSRELFLNERLAKFLGAERQVEENVAPDEFVRCTSETEERQGVVTHPLLVASLAYSSETSPIHRGVFLARNLLGRSLRPPPEAVAPLAPELKPGLTTRERVALQTSPPACQNCHVMINRLGFTLERFDAVGRYRTEELGRPVDTTGGYIGRDGQQSQFQNARDLAQFMAGSEDGHESLIGQLIEHVSKQPALAYGPETIENQTERFKQNGYNIRQAFVDAVVLTTLGANQK